MQGYLVLFDLSGYTEFLVGSDLERAPGILHSLIGTTLEHVDAPLRIAEIEGDAIFAYARDDAFGAGGDLLGAIERVYCAFAAAREQMDRNATCDCAGCRLLPHLDLKVVAHHGSFALGRMLPGTPDKPMGVDVVLAHRLLKNRITERTGVKAYVFLTDACVRALGIVTDSGVQHAEVYEHVGSVSGCVHDLEQVWAVEREKRLVRVLPGDAWVEIHVDIGAPLEAVWDAVCTPAFRSVWRLSEPLDPIAIAGRSAQYCYTGEMVAADRVVDWQPFHRMTLECEGPDGTGLRVTVDLSRVSAGTQVVARIGAPEVDPGEEVRHQVRQRAWQNLDVLRRWATAGSAVVARGLPIVDAVSASDVTTSSRDGSDAPAID